MTRTKESVLFLFSRLHKLSELSSNTCCSEIFAIVRKQRATVVLSNDSGLSHYNPPPPQLSGHIT